MYNAPDYEVVSIDAKDVFAAYGDTGCHYDDGYDYVAPCYGKPEMEYVTYVGLNWGSRCYSTFNP